MSGFLKGMCFNFRFSSNLVTNKRAKPRVIGNLCFSANLVGDNRHGEFRQRCCTRTVIAGQLPSGRFWSVSPMISHFVVLALECNFSFSKVVRIRRSRNVRRGERPSSCTPAPRPRGGSDGSNPSLKMQVRKTHLVPSGFGGIAGASKGR